MSEISFIHTPFGQEHPYEQLPEERFPRYPLAGKPFTVGIVTRPPGVVQAVRVHTRVDGGTEVAIKAERLTEWQPELEQASARNIWNGSCGSSRTCGMRELIAPEVGQTLTYQIEADGVLGESIRWLDAAGRRAEASKSRRWKPIASEMRLSREGKTTGDRRR